MRFSFTKRDSWVTNGTLALHFTNLLYIMRIYAIIIKEFCALYTYGVLNYDRTHDIQGIY